MTDLIEAHLAWLTRGDATHRPRAKRTIDERASILRNFDRKLPDGLAAASADELDTVLDLYRPGPDDEPNWTLPTYDTALRVFYDWAVRHGSLGFDPMIHIGRPGPGPRIPHPCSDDELALALTAPPWPWRRAVMLAAYAGLRCTEICTVTTTDVIGNRLRVFGKGRKVRLVPVAPVLADELAGTPAGNLLVGAQGRPINGRVLSAMQRPIWRAIGLAERISLHSFRHWYVTRLIENGATVAEAAALAGHASWTTTQGYAAVVDQRLSAAVGRLPLVGQAGPDGSRPGLPVAA